MIIKQVREGVWRGSRPESNNDFQTIVDLCIKYILILENVKGVTDTEIIKWKSLNIEPITYQLSEILPPNFIILNECAYYIKNHQPIFVHCLHGVDRTGAVIFANRIKNCVWDFNRAYQEMIDEGHHVFFYWWWKSRLKRYAKIYGRGGDN